MERGTVAGKRFVPDRTQAARGARDHPNLTRRQLALLVAVAVLSFATAFGLGALTKRRTVYRTSPQLAPLSSVRAPQRAGIAAISATPAVPDLKSPPPKHVQSKPVAQAVPSNPNTQGGGSTPGGGGTPRGGGGGGSGGGGSGGSGGGGSGP